ncbi:hypothetical protein QZH41_015003, partial [Actinostola sp. cb2023]
VAEQETIDIEEASVQTTETAAENIEDEKQSDVEQLCGAMLHLSINAGSTYEPGSQDSSSSDTSNDNGSHHTRSLAVQRLLLNEFLRSCDAGTIGPYKKQWNEASARTRNSHVCKAKALVVAGLNVITPGDAGFLLEALKESGTVEKELGTGEQQEDRRYLEALAESYHNASCWETRRQILSIMVDLITFKRMQFYIPGAFVRTWAWRRSTPYKKPKNAS